jgi:preprotein translocase subunit SecA
VIVGEFTVARYPAGDGADAQAVEARRACGPAGRALATIAFQNYFRLYDRQRHDRHSR